LVPGDLVVAVDRHPGMRVGFANGCFDLFHEGHRHFLTACRTQCDYLVVAVNSDAYCTRVKGQDRPHETLQLRMMRVRSFAEAVFPFEGREEPLIMQIRPDVIFKGGDHSPELKHYCARGIGWKEGAPIWKAPVVHIGRVDGISTTLAAQARGLAP
jgi:D-beta-D-heptose 7-phosphate kinase/D-beta-D-heptose 1-phosphate adenosyltransferase